MQQATETSSGDQAARRRGRRSMILVTLLFVLPLLLAVALFAADWRPGGSVNRGELINPPLDAAGVALEAVDGGETHRLTGRWTLLHTLEGSCDTSCLQRLYDTRQVRLAVGRDIDRVQRYLLVTDVDALAEVDQAQHPDLVLLRAPSEDILASETGVRIVDPLGNVMMRYDPVQPAEDMLKDLKRLLKLSTVG